MVSPSSSRRLDCASVSGITDNLDCRMSGDSHGNKVMGVQQRPGGPGLVSHLITTGVENLYEGITVATVRKIHEGRPNVLDHLANGAIALIVNTPSGKGARTDEGRIRAAAVSHGVPCITTVNGAKAAVAALERLRAGDLNVYALQDLLKS